VTPNLVLDTSPSKRIFYSITRDYDHNLGICELVDNVVDAWSKGRRGRTVHVKISLDKIQQTITVTDDAGGVPQNLLRNIVGPGLTGNDENDETIGIFGVGTKRAVVALSQDVSIQTRRGHGSTFEVKLDDEWLKTETWRLPYRQIPNIAPSETRVLLSRLRSPLTDQAETTLREHLGATYSRIISAGAFEIKLGTDLIAPIEFENWAYPPGAEPKRYSQAIETPDYNPVAMEMTVGLTRESSPGGGEYGVYLYCNGRLVCRGLKSYDVGFTRGLVGNPHPSISIVRAIVSLRGPAILMPWNSTKSGIDPQSKVFQRLNPILVPALKAYASVSRALSAAPGGWPENVYHHDAGEISAFPLEGEIHLPDLHLPQAPRSRPRHHERIAHANQAVADAKPWTRGLYEGVAAARILLDSALEEGPRFALILLDSTLEIAFKEYLVNEVAGGISNAHLRALFENRHLVEQEVKNHLTISNQNIGKIRFYYNLRCDLVHRKTSPAVSDEAVRKYGMLVQRLLTQMFALRFEEL